MTPINYGIKSLWQKLYARYLSIQGHKKSTCLESVISHLLSDSRRIYVLVFYEKFVPLKKNLYKFIYDPVKDAF